MRLSFLRGWQWFTIEPVVPFEFAGYDLSFTNSAAWMLVTVA